MPRASFRDTTDSGILGAALSAVSGIEFSSVAVGVSCKDAAEKPRLRKLLEDYFSGSLGKKVVKGGHDLYFLLKFDLGYAEATPQSVCIEGRYNKYSRDIAQTFHYCYKCKGRGCAFCKGKGKLSELSVQELLDKKLLPLFVSNESRFHGCGREDVDVLMLGAGRPFVYEAMFPMKRSADLAAIEGEINREFSGKIAVHGLHFCPVARIAEIKNAKFKKIYSAKCACDEGISVKELASLPGKSLEIAQRTPERVEKRRVMKERAKAAKLLTVLQLSEKEFTVEILASHGLYIKEFVSGDNGRTVPSISSLLGKKCECRELDVLEIVLQ